MRMNIYVQRNKVLKCTGQPLFDDHEPDVYATQYKRALQVGPAEKVFALENVDIYHLATYDDETMELIPNEEPTKILDCGLVLEDRCLRDEILAAAKKKRDEEEKKESLKNESK